METISPAAKNSNVSPRQIRKLPKRFKGLDASLPRFGPLYGSDDSVFEAAKEGAWQHILEKSLPIREAVTTECYMSAMRQVEEAARRAYADDEYLHKLTGTEFRWMMIKDGCFFLQLSLFLLGKDLGYSADHVIFGKNSKTKDWIRSFFFVGNQIPFLVLKQLLKQSFFRKQIDGWKLKRHPDPDLSRAVLYDFLVLPELDELRKQDFCTWLKSFRRRPPLEAFDLLHAVQILIVGPEEGKKNADKYEGEEEVDDEVSLESEWEAKGEDPEATELPLLQPLAATDKDLEAQRPHEATDQGPLLQALAVADEDPEDQRRPHEATHQAPLLQPRAADDDKRFRRATELRQAGIFFSVVKDKGSKSIRFQTCFLCARLYLPQFPFDQNTVMVFENLKRYERNQPICKNNLEAQSYLRFLSEIITTPEDAKLLADNGIVGKGRRYHEKLPKTLKKLSTKEDYNHRFRQLSSEISDFSSPSWAKITLVVSFFSVVISIFTIVQTVYTILPYYKKGPGQ